MHARLDARLVEEGPVSAAAIPQEGTLRGGDRGGGQGGASLTYAAPAIAPHPNPSPIRTSRSDLENLSPLSLCFHMFPTPLSPRCTAEQRVGARPRGAPEPRHSRACVQRCNGHAQPPVWREAGSLRAAPQECTPHCRGGEGGGAQHLKSVLHTVGGGGGGRSTSRVYFTLQGGGGAQHLKGVLHTTGWGVGGRSISRVYSTVQGRGGGRAVNQEDIALLQIDRDLDADPKGSTASPALDRRRDQPFRHPGPGWGRVRGGGRRSRRTAARRTSHWHSLLLRLSLLRRGLLGGILGYDLYRDMHSLLTWRPTRQQIPSSPPSVFFSCSVTDPS